MELDWINLRVVVALGESPLCIVCKKTSVTNEVIRASFEYYSNIRKCTKIFVSMISNSFYLLVTTVHLVQSILNQWDFNVQLVIIVLVGMLNLYNVAIIRT